MTDTAADLYYDPYDWGIDTDPYPVWRRLRDEAPLYYNERYDFFALSRFDDVERTSIDWRTYRSGKGSVLELIKSGVEIPPGNILFEDPPAHDVHRALLSRVFTPRRVRHPLLPREPPRPPRRSRRARGGPRALPRLAGRLGPRGARPHDHGPRLGAPPGLHLVTRTD
jgi:hypothetical protein